MKPGVAEHIDHVLTKRRDKLLRYAFRNMLALDYPRVARSGSAQVDDEKPSGASSIDPIHVRLVDLEVVAGLRDSRGAHYHWELREDETGRVLSRGLANEPTFPVTKMRSNAVDFATLGVRRADDHVTRSPRVEIHLRQFGGHVIPIALSR